MTMAHRHAAQSTSHRPYFGPVTGDLSGYYRQNSMAHGNVTRVDRCRCGAERRTNVNQGHVERGRWTPEEA